MDMMTRNYPSTMAQNHYSNEAKLWSDGAKSWSEQRVVDKKMRFVDNSLFIKNVVTSCVATFVG